MEKEEIKRLESLKKYLDLGSIEDVEKYEQIIEELSNYGDWGEKVQAYLTAILSGTNGTRAFISPEKIELFNGLFNI